MLCRPFEKYIPRFFKRDDKLIAFADKMDELMDDFEEDTLGLNKIIDPTKAPVVTLAELGYYLNAGIKPFDTEKQKRIKIGTAIRGHKKRGSFKFDAKPKIDAIAGGDSVIIRGFSGDDWILVGDGTEPNAYYWATMGCDGIDLDLGISLVGDGTEIEIAGNIYIDVDNSLLTPTQVEQIVIELQDDIVGSYLRVFIGYVDLSGSFIIYDIIG